jgi:hypothetical protein
VRNETAAWLNPMIVEAEKRGIDMDSLFLAATAEDPFFFHPDDSERKQGLTDWGRLGELLRNALGWDWYPSEPWGECSCDECRKGGAAS